MSQSDTFWPGNDREFEANLRLCGCKTVEIEDIRLIGQALPSETKSVVENSRYTKLFAFAFRCEIYYQHAF